MGRLSDSAANNDLDVRFGRAASDAPASYWLGLSATKPTGAGGNVTEPPASAGYARVEIPNTPAAFPAAAGRRKTNGVAVQFPTATAGWGPLPYSVLYTAATGGRLDGWGDNGPFDVDLGAAPRLPIGSLTILTAG